MFSVGGGYPGSEAKATHRANRVSARACGCAVAVAVAASAWPGLRMRGGSTLKVRSGTGSPSDNCQTGLTR